MQYRINLPGGETALCIKIEPAVEIAPSDATGTAHLTHRVKYELAGKGLAGYPEARTEIAPGLAEEMYRRTELYTERGVGLGSLLQQIRLASHDWQQTIEHERAIQRFIDLPRAVAVDI